MNQGQLKYPLCYLCLCGAVVWEVVGSSTAILFIFEKTDEEMKRI